jgi:soluble lytic murein transglycosylase-like protein
MPTEHAIYTGRPVEAILKPPSKQKTGERRGAEASRERAPKEYSLDPKLNARINGNLERYESIIADASKRFNVPANLIKGVIQQESGGNPEICSSVGAGGLMQLMPDTARGLGLTEIYPIIVERTESGRKKYRLDPRDARANPENNIMAGARLLGQLLQKYGGNVDHALAAYNWGSGNVDKYLRGEKGMPRETTLYISNIPRMVASLDKAEKGTQA